MLGEGRSNEEVIAAVPRLASGEVDLDVRRLLLRCVLRHVVAELGGPEPLAARPDEREDKAEREALALSCNARPATPKRSVTKRDPVGGLAASAPSVSLASHER